MLTTTRRARSHPNRRKKPKKKRRAVTIGIVTALIVLLGAAAWFLLSYYFVRADALRVVRCTTEELTVALESGDKAADFRLTCSDMYGNSYPATAADGQYVFSGLSENTQYTITVTAADGHRLSSRGVSTLSVTTPGGHGDHGSDRLPRRCRPAAWC